MYLLEAHFQGKKKFLIDANGERYRLRNGKNKRRKILRYFYVKEFYIHITIIIHEKCERDEDILCSNFFMYNVYNVAKEFQII